LKKDKKMSLNIGDKVSFINEKREGIVKKLLKNNMVSVEIEDGFEIPILIKELIKTESTNKASSSDINLTEVKQLQENTPSTIEEVINDDTITVTSLLDDSTFKQEGLFWAIEDYNENSTCKIYVVNKTPYDVLFSCYHKKHNLFTPFVYDALGSNSKYFVAEISKSESHFWQHILLQALYFSENKQLPIKEPISIKFEIPSQIWIKQSNFSYYKMFDGYYFLLSMDGQSIKDDDENWQNEKIAAVSKRNIKDMLASEKNTYVLDKKHFTAPYIAEVDLHIEKLKDAYNQMSKHDMLQYQINYFTKCLDAAIVLKFKKITFIHGVGNGYLKKHIHDIIAESYPGIKIQDAPLSKYGNGATEVLIPFNLVY